VKFNSNISTSGAGDSIVSRQWIFGDSSAIGTTRDPSHKYTKSGNYNVCLYIKTKGGCESKECKQVNVTIPATPVIACRANFSTIADGATLKFNSSNSNGGAGDSIISRQWIFGDSSAIGTTVDPSHKYAKSGVYNVCLYIKTKGGCESKECKQVSVTVPTTSPTLTKCAAQFTSTRVSPKKIIFNSSTSLVATNDTIVERSWGFGDGSATLTGNIIKPAKEFSKAGIYTVCLKIKTAKGCNNSYCSTIRIEDTATAPVATTDPVKIISVRPNPVVSPLTTEVWSKFNNITAELSVYDIYGTKKVSLSKVLLQGNNITPIPTAFLMPGPYFFRVTTMYGVKSTQFYKL
jgi:PKD repeat protein